MLWYALCEMKHDAMIIGGGPAGLSAALILGRCGRSVVIFDAGRPRNYAARQIHNYLTRDGVDPARLRQISLREISRYRVMLHRELVVKATRREGGFQVRTNSGRMLGARTLLIATGVADLFPNLRNFHAFYGAGVHHCPYCDALTYKDRPIAVYGSGRAALGLAMCLRTWSRELTLVTDGTPVDSRTRREAKLLGFALRVDRIRRLCTRGGQNAPARGDPFGAIDFENGPPLIARALFFNTGQVQRSDLPAQLGCITNKDGGIAHDKRQRTCVPGLFLAGDASRDVQFVIVAAAEGAKAGVAMNRYLQDIEIAAALASATEA